MIPLSLIIPIVGGAVLFAAGTGAGWHIRDHSALKAAAVAAAERTAAAQDAQKREAAARAEERRTTFRVMETADAAHLQASDARRDANQLARDADRLRTAYIEYVTAHSATTGAAIAASGAAATRPGLVLGHLLGGADARLRSCASALDAARIAGTACERAYDAVRGEP